MGDVAIREGIRRNRAFVAVDRVVRGGLMIASEGQVPAHAKDHSLLKTVSPERHRHRNSLRPLPCNAAGNVQQILQVISQNLCDIKSLTMVV